MSDDRRQTGRRGERDAIRFLKQRGYRIVARNFTCPLGELDAVVLRDGVLSIVEVKTHHGLQHRPEEAVDARKQRKLARVAEYFLRARKMTDTACQFDVVAVNYDQHGKPDIVHFPDAFEPP